MNAAANSSAEAGAFDPAERWFPNFCRPPVVFSLMVLAQLVVLVMWLAPVQHNGSLQALAVGSLFGQWVIGLCAVSLCKLRHWLQRSSVTTGLSLAYLLVLALVAAATVSAVGADRFAGFGLTSGGPSLAEYTRNNVLIAALVAAAALRYYYIQQQWRAGVQAQSEAQVRALQARIRPHFLFNSMNTIASLIRSKPQVAEEAVLNLCDLFRAALSESSQDSTLGQELELCRRYMEIEELRLGNRLKVQWDVEQLPRREPLPALILQPLLENAVYHGVQPLPEGGQVTISGDRDNANWWVSILNPRPQNPTLSKSSNYMALENIRQRLTHRFAGEAKLTVAAEPDSFKVTVTVPVEETG